MRKKVSIRLRRTQSSNGSAKSDSLDQTVRFATPSIQKCGREVRAVAEGSHIAA